ncbi:hypothetical protein EGI16_21570 [Chryseobacterium sp. G0240]|uniref:helix-turn-helix transcriptional regulator n=1 Tax=Chryseobacterium sp. G0240 TaxID=2487066 RepID=UPI000F45D93C|nr:hypothetical protein [Chryseobacterium sp. G0240]ROH98269.1 hypothetical protein EGI16_21570 [Chryseobacterium sp. G0240]
MKDIEKLLIDYLADGYSQYEIAEKLKERGIKPNSLSSVEKHLNKIKENYEAKSLFHLACILHKLEILGNTDSRNSD